MQGNAMTHPPDIDDQTIALITERVVAALRDELEAIAMKLLARNGSQPLTVGEVAERFGVARSTVYAHWREWGGYKLGASAKAPIRFEGTDLPMAPAAPQPLDTQPAARRRRTRRRGELIPDQPRFDPRLEELG
jgi:DNA-binding transcriptional ArsR family regulator